MKELIIQISDVLMDAFEKSGYERDYGRVSVSNRPDLCEYQCNGSMAAAKAAHQNPFDIATKVVENICADDMFSKVEVVRPGFINIDISPKYLAGYANAMYEDGKNLAYDKVEKPRTVIIDYGGPNVAKPLHVGHLRAAIIGESVKRIHRFVGENVIGDVHLGDWGQQMGLIISLLRERKPDLPYFDDSFEGEYPKDAPFTLDELEEIYPTASAKSKEDEDFKNTAMATTRALQSGHRGYNAILSHILELSIADLKKSYARLHVDFDLWKGESDAAPYIDDMVNMLKEKGFAYESDDALVVDVSEPEDTKEVPPCMILKSDGAALYNTTDLATLVYRMKDYKPDEIIYVVDKRQGLYFTQVFRCAKKTGIVPETTNLVFQGFGTMNGSDKKPFKTRSGGVMKLSDLLDDIKDAMLKKIADNETIEESKREEIASQIALSAIKYGDLSNQPSKDYVFDVGRFTSFEGDTGPYILYTMVRIKSILRKYEEQGGKNAPIPALETSDGKQLLIESTKFATTIGQALKELAPNRICAYIYDLANAFNGFYHNTKILACEDEDLKAGYIALLKLVLNILEVCIDLLGFEAPERM